MDILIFLYLLIYLILAKIRLDWAVMFLLFALPSYLIRFSILGVPFTLLEGMILITFAVWLLFHTEFRNFIRGKYGLKEFRANRKKRVAYPFGLEIILLLIVVFIAVAVAGFSDSALGIWKAYFFEPALVFILLLNVFKKDLNKIIWPLAISVLVVSVLAIYQKFTGVWIFNEFWADPGNRRVVSFFGYPNAVGLFLGPLVLLFIGWICNCMQGVKKQVIGYKLWVIGFIFLTTALSLLAIYFAKSKGALLGIGVGLIVFGLLANKKLKWGIVSVMLVAVIGISMYAPARNFIYGKIVYSKSLQIRQAQWQETWEMLKDGRIITGTGLANYQAAIEPYHVEGFFYNDGTDPDFHRHTVFNKEYRARVWQPLEIYLYPHNVFLNFWTELGLAGLLLFGWVILKFFCIGAKMLRQPVISYKLLVIGLLCSMVVIVIHGLVDVPYFKNDLAVMFWVLLAMLGVLNLRRKAS